MDLFKNKTVEAMRSVLPIALLVLLISMTICPLPAGVCLLFLLGVAFLIVGTGLFTLGAEMSMQSLGAKIGFSAASSGKVWLIAFVGFVIGVAVTVSEPDLQILAEQVGFENNLLIFTVSAGVGLFLLLALLRQFFGVSLRLSLGVFYLLAFLLCIFVDKGLLSLAFDSGGVTTGPMTVPFLMALGAGVASVRHKGDGGDDSFGMIGLCSVGPIVSVLVLGIATAFSGAEVPTVETVVPATTRAGAGAFLSGLLEYSPEVGFALLPILSFALIFQLITRAFGKKQLIRIGVGTLYVFVGLVLFLTGANVGFMPVGSTIGKELAGAAGGAWLVPVSMLLGFFIVRAEPAVYVLNRQVEEISCGAISRRTTVMGLSVGVAAALGLSMLRILFDIPVMYILIPGYVLALVLTFFVPNMFVGIAFDSGGVASGTMMSAFVLPMALGACETLGVDKATQGFGCVALVALTPVLSVQIFGLIYSIKKKQNTKRFVSQNENFLSYHTSVGETEEVS